MQALSRLHPLIESLTPLLLNIARYNKIRDVGIQFH